MADYTGSKFGLGALEPSHAVETPFDRLEPLITPEKVRTQFLFGIPLVSNVRDPITHKAMVMNDTMVGDIIVRMVSQVEADVGIDIFPVKRTEKYPFDRQLYDSLCYFQLQHRPCSSLDSLQVVPANGQATYTVPLDWVETAYLNVGQINVVPINIAMQNGGFVPSQTSGGAMFLALLGQHYWLPAFWQITYTSGFPDGLVPRHLNELIGIYTAMEILSQLAATYAATTGHSLGYDGMSQSISTPGPQLFATRMQELDTKRQALVGKIKAKYGFKLFSGTL